MLLIGLRQFFIRGRCPQVSLGFMSHSFIAEVIISHPSLPLTPTIREIPEIAVQVKSQPFTHLESPCIFYSVENTSFSSFEAALLKDSTVKDWRLLFDFTDCRIYQVSPSSEAKFTMPKIVDLGIQVLSIENAEQGWRFRLQAPDKEALGAYWQYCREEDVQFNLEKLYRSGPQTMVPDTDSLTAQFTDRQQEVVRTAVEMGYYDQDGASAQEVADELGISKSTLSTHLRRSTAKVFHHLFRDNE